jgi:predicted GIY-YIG superfamily endonuclease
MNNWQVYIIHNSGSTYVGVSPDPIRRLRQHNKEICGGAKYTSKKNGGWLIICTIKGFDKINALRFEWSLKHIPPMNKWGPYNRITKLYVLLNKERWTKQSPMSSTVCLHVEWLQTEYRRHDFILPNHITESIVVPNIINEFKNIIIIDSHGVDDVDNVE